MVYGAKRKAYIEANNAGGGKRAKDKEVSAVTNITKQVDSRQYWADTAYVQDEKATLKSSVS